MTIADIIEQRNIEEVVHFTTNLGLTGILYSKTIKSRERLAKSELLEFIYSPNADTRKDEHWLDYVNLSISRINRHFFRASDGWHRHRDIWWCVISLSPEILTNEGVYFCTTNNIYTGVERGAGAEGLEALFADRIVRWWSNIAQRSSETPPNHTTCEQAEVLYPGEIPVDYLNRIYVASGEIADEVHGLLRVLGYSDIEIVVKPEIFVI